MRDASDSHRKRARRLAGLPATRIGGLQLPVATTYRSRLLGLAFLPRAHAGPGLLIPRCRSVHTAGMRFRLDIVFLGFAGEVVSMRRGVLPWRVLHERRARSVLELPSGQMTYKLKKGGAECFRR